ncbi:hypothetical protein CU097_009932 [Rhizopus azygosporus]|uniref:Coth-domain-containing protein n=1 Tax=Rhizopus azygosporus TaxID=86630 RepID=A0A367K371_RHIAZ|nr:hypothetical protein CU097_009932 [Rhizopus azygosporus]
MTIVFVLSVVHARWVTYSVIVSVSAGQSVGVLVDGRLTLLSPSSYEPLLYKGRAQDPAMYYRYVIVDGQHQIVESESFNRRIDFDVDVTGHEFFNRPINVHDIFTLPKVMPDLAPIRRIRSDLHIANQIPTIHLRGNQTAIDYLHGNQLQDITLDVGMTYIGLDDVYTYKTVKLSLAGRGSRWVPKVSYTVKIKDGTSLFGYTNVRLRALAKDPSYVREAICHSVLQSVGLPVSGFSYVRLFINNRPIGLFGIIEDFNTQWLQNEFAGNIKNYRVGRLYQGQGFFKQGLAFAVSDLAYEEDITKYAVGQYDVEEPSEGVTLKDLVPLQDFTRFIRDSSVETTPIEVWEQKMNMESFIRAMVIENLLGLSDGYMATANNYYLYMDPLNGGQIIYMPHDMDATVGRYSFKEELMTSGDFKEHPGFLMRPLTTKVFVYEPFLKYYQELLVYITKTLVNPEIMDVYVNSIVRMIKVDVEWDQQLPKVGTFSRPPSDLTQINLDIIVQALKKLPSGFLIANPTDPPATAPFTVAVYSPEIIDKRLDGVLRFIHKKASNILAFYRK